MNDSTPSLSRPRPLRRGLRVAAAIAVLGTVGFWAAKGAHRGWSMNQVPKKQTDEITGLEFVTYEKRYVPGVDFLGIGAGLGATLMALSFLAQRKSTNSNS